MKEENINFEGKNFDYFEASNACGEDLVSILRKADELHALCKANKVPICIGLITQKKGEFLYSTSYDPDWDDKNYSKLFIMAGGFMKFLKESLGIVMKFEKIDFSEQK